MGWFRRKRAQSQPSDPQGERPRFFLIRGRRVLADDPYVLPKDMSEVNRLDFQHFMLRYTLRGNYVAPLQPRLIRNIIDVGTGTGRWAREMATQFPMARVVGVDRVAPAGDSMRGLPPNYSFAEGNVLTGLPFPDGSFDFVHMRLLYSAIPAQQWPVVLRDLVRITRPGGWVELVEAASIENRTPVAEQLNTWVIDACSRRGLDMAIAPRLGSMIETVGIPRVTTRQITLPIGAYGGRLGSMLETDIMEIYRSVIPLVVGQGITSQEAYDRAVQQFQADVKTHQMVFPFYVIYGQRPR
ncbi:MAG TPA: class I SAM-dependent methyltransferase, partial [Ktedonobacterales bacterium]|nr:class I SAM-dependent methyltransferase [Ktedonobacterales bacterium]